MKTPILILIVLTAASIALIFAVGVLSPKGSTAVSPYYWNQTSSISTSSSTNYSAIKYISNCTSPNLNFSYYGAISNVSAKTGSSSISEIYVTNKGNVTENISISATPIGNVPFKVEVPGSVLDNVSSTVYFQYILPNLQTIGKYTIQMGIRAVHGDCEKSVSFPVSVNITS